MSTTPAIDFMNTHVATPRAIATAAPLQHRLAECEHEFGVPRAPQFDQFVELSGGRFIQTFAFAPAGQNFPSRESAFFFTFADQFASGRFFEDFPSFFEGMFFENRAGV